MFENATYISCGKFVSRGVWTHPDRVLDSHETILVTKGMVYINENGHDYILQVGDTILLQANARHYGYRSSTDTEFFWFHWRDDSLVFSEEKHRKIEDIYTISLYFRRLLQSRVEDKPAECFHYLIRLILSEIYYGGSNPHVNHTAESIAAWIKANRHTAIKASHVAARFGYNVDYLNRMFKTNFSKSIKEYIDDERMKHIKAMMLSDNISLGEIAEKAGFSQYKYFLKFFKYHEGITPTQFYRETAKLYINTR